ncbi:MAG: YggS family pyridoxal phosphate-dependent enzyme [Verrucomicrobia bacterium]|nr:YggS family pyridoxal phosphate-dependent enzyme [Verrucomicrobiota bacterium]
MELERNLHEIRARMLAACRKAGRDPDTVRLLAVTKNQPPDRVREAADLGLQWFGENRIQEAKAKIPLCPSHLHWHFIGHLQSNKCRDASLGFSMIESVDSLSLARELEKWAARSAKKIPVLLEVNVAGESSKFGYRPDALRAEIEAINALPHLEVQGLMTLAPWAPDPEKARPVFRRLRELKEECGRALGAPLPELSMGMSGDFEVAIEEGATIIRVGTALFGNRPPRAS